ncbi:Peroxin 13, N-terminal region-domain-containing protein [Abortiporus biennis]|nr:Peroxin 13, N-terminal region-domain-containing protein [Abortiporus biennis]
MPSPPKPWERNGSVAASAPASTLSSVPMSSPTPTQTTPSASTPSSSVPPSVPARPAALAGAATAAFPNSYNNTYNSPYSSYGSTPYSRFGSTYGSSYSPYGMNSMYGGTMGGYGGYSGYGGYGMNGMYGGGMPGMGFGGQPGPFDPMNPSLSQTLESTTQHTFALLHSIVQTFSGVAQMLESTFMATHSSFFAMVGVIDQFGQLRNALGSVLGLFGLVRWMKDLLTGRASNPMRGEFREFINGRPVQGPQPPAPKASKKPLIIFLLAIFGIPYAMHKLVKIITERQQAQQGQAQLVPGQPGALPPLDPSQLTFARALYPFEASSPAELSLKENEIVAIMAKLDPSTGAEVESEWWKGRTREGREGWFPKKWVQTLERKKPIEEGKKVD